MVHDARTRDSSSAGPGHPRRLRTPETLSPGYFAMVMATGIVSIGAQLRGFTLLATLLFWLAVGFYVVLVALTVWRFVAHRHMMSEDFHDPARAFGFFTFIAAANVLGAALVGVGREVLSFGDFDGIGEAIADSEG